MKQVFENNPLNNMIPGDKALISYLNNELGAEEKRAIEELINDDPLVGDAIEGLRGYETNTDLVQLNKALTIMIDRQIRKKKKKKSYSPTAFPLWMVLLITLTLLAIIGGYVLISMLQK